MNRFHGRISVDALAEIPDSSTSEDTMEFSMSSNGKREIAAIVLSSVRETISHSIPQPTSIQMLAQATKIGPHPAQGSPTNRRAQPTCQSVNGLFGRIAPRSRAVDMKFNEL